MKNMRVSHGSKRESSGQTLVTVEPSTRAALEVKLPTGKTLQIVVLTREQALSATRISIEGGEHLVLSAQQVYSDGRAMTLQAFGRPEFPFLGLAFVGCNTAKQPSRRASAR